MKKLLCILGMVSLMMFCLDVSADSNFLDWHTATWWNSGATTDWAGIQFIDGSMTNIGGNDYSVTLDFYLCNKSSSKTWFNLTATGTIRCYNSGGGEVDYCNLAGGYQVYDSSIKQSIYANCTGLTTTNVAYCGVRFGNYFGESSTLYSTFKPTSYWYANSTAETYVNLPNCNQTDWEETTTTTTTLPPQFEACQPNQSSAYIGEIVLIYSLLFKGSNNLSDVWAEAWHQPGLNITSTPQAANEGENYLLLDTTGATAETYGLYCVANDTLNNEEDMFWSELHVLDTTTTSTTTTSTTTSTTLGAGGNSTIVSYCAPGSTYALSTDYLNASIYCTSTATLDDYWIKLGDYQYPAQGTAGYQYNDYYFDVLDFTSGNYSLYCFCNNSEGVINSSNLDGVGYEAWIYINSDISSSTITSTTTLLGQPSYTTTSTSHSTTTTTIYAGDKWDLTGYIIENVTNTTIDGVTVRTRFIKGGKTYYRTDTSDLDGSYHADDIYDLAQVQITINEQPYSPFYNEFVMTDDLEYNITLDYLLNETPSYGLSGFVIEGYSEDENPIKGAIIVYDGNVKKQATSNTYGEWSLEVPKGYYDVLISKSGYKNAVYNDVYVSAPRSDVVYELYSDKEYYTVTGYVYLVNGTSKSKVYAHVYAYEGGSNVDDTWTSGTNGAFSFNLAKGTYVFEAQTTGYGSAKSNEVYVNQDRSVEILIQSLQQSYEVNLNSTLAMISSLFLLLLLIALLLIFKAITTLSK